MADVQAAAKRKVQRSPNYPAISLETALLRARALHRAEGRHKAPVAVAMRHWGYANPTSSSAMGTLSAVIKFGLIASEGLGKARQVQLTDSALKIILDERDPSPERDRLIREAALLPSIYKEMWDKWGASLPSEQMIRTYLLMEKHFNAAAVDDLIKDYRATLAFSGLDNREEQPEDDRRNGNVVVGSFVQWRSQGVDQFPEPRLVTGITDDGAWAFVEASQTGIPVAELVLENPPSGPAPLVAASRSAPPVNPNFKPAANAITDAPGFEILRIRSTKGQYCFNVQRR